MLNYLHIAPAVLAILLLLCSSCAQAAPIDQQWTDEEIYAANTAADCPYLTQDGKDMILYNNLARLYPKKFAVVELRDWKPSSYLYSLIRTLNTMEPVQALTVNARSTDLAQCWATESGRKGLFGHNRVDCPSCQNGMISGENCFYGKTDGRVALLELIVDEGIPDLGHRDNCLYPQFSSVGIGIAEHHSNCHICFVMDFTSEEGEDYRPQDCSTRTSQPEVAPETEQEPAPKPQQVESASNDHTHSSDTVYVYVRPSEQNATDYPSANLPSVSVTPSGNRNNAKPNLLNRYYEQSGKGAVSFVSVGYMYSLADRRHMCSLSLFDFRFWIFGISPLCAEMSVSPLDARIAYRPTLKFFIPISSTLAVTPYAGVAVDASRVTKYIYPGYDYHQQDFYLNAIVGVSLSATTVKHVPFELKFEYRHPTYTLSSSNYHSSGLYIGAQLYFARTW